MARRGRKREGRQAGTVAGATSEVRLRSDHSLEHPIEVKAASRIELERERVPLTSASHHCL
eukprot:3623891-Alexandrium_andersonii.AAC.1